MVLRSVVFTIALILPGADHAIAQGGQDILVERFADGEITVTNLHHLVAASDGTLFNVMELELTDGTGVLRVWRSTNGGSTWRLWGDITDPDVDFQSIQAAVVQSVSAERLLVAYTRWNPNAGADKGAVKVHSARVNAAAPNWLSAVIDGPGTSNFLDVRLDAFPVAGGPSRVHVAYLDFDGATGWHRTFARSLDGGSTWSAPADLGPLSSLSYFEQDIVSDESGAVHWFWTERPTGDDASSLYLQTATNDGTLAADWGAISVVDTVGASYYRPFAAADPAGDGLLVALGETGRIRLLVSADGGASWPFADKVLDWMYSPAPDWGADGPAVGMKFNILPDYPGMVGYGLARPQAGPGGDWAVKPLIMRNSSFIGEASAVAVPTRGGQFAVAGLMQDVETDEDVLFFDAEWRGDPGFGVLEALVPVTYDYHSWYSSPVAGDIDGDGDLELVYQAYTPDPDLWRYDIETDTATMLVQLDNPWGASDPALVDMDGDGDLEVFYTSGGDVFGLHGDGSPVPGFPASPSGSYGSFPSAGQVTGYNHGEVVLASNSRDIVLLGPDGRMMPGFPFTPPAAAANSAGREAIGDVDGDGQVDIVASFFTGVAIISNTGQLQAWYEFPDVDVYAPSLADLDDDGDLEIVLPTLAGLVYVIHHTGESFGPGWPHDTGTVLPTDAIALADVTGDGRRDLVFAMNDSLIHVVDTDGNPVAELPAAIEGGMARRSPIVARLGPNGMGVARGGYDGLMHIFTGQQEQDGWPRDFEIPIEATSLAADLDGDDSMELVVLGQEKMWVLDMGVPTGPARRGWPMDGARPGRTSCADCPGYTASAVGEPTLPPVPTLLHPNVPNPFNPSTAIRFAVPDHAADVRLRIFDTRGRLVRTLVDEVRQPGDHTVTWNGRDGAGRTVASGVYLMRLDVGGMSQMRSMVLAR